MAGEKVIWKKNKYTKKSGRGRRTQGKVILMYSILLVFLKKFIVVQLQLF